MWSAPSAWYGGRRPKDELEDLYDSDDYDSDDFCLSQAPEDNIPKQVVRTSSLSSADSWLELAMEEEDDETILTRVEAKIAASSSTALKGIPLRTAEAMDIKDCQSSLAGQAPPVEEPSQTPSGGDHRCVS